MIRKIQIPNIDSGKICQILIFVLVLFFSIGCTTGKIKGLDGSFLGEAVHINKNGILIGAPGGVGGGGDLDGLAHLFSPSSEGWNHRNIFKARHPRKLISYDFFGDSLSLAENVALIGAWGDDDNGPASGSAHIFERTQSKWQQTAKLTIPDTANRSLFGRSVATDGSVAVVGAPGANRSTGKLIPISGWSGNVYIWSKEKTGWQFQQKLTPGLLSTPASMDDWVWSFGNEVAVAEDIIVISAHQGTLSPGQVYIFRRHNKTWTREAILDSKLKGFATSIAIFNETIAVAAYKTIFIYTYSNGDWRMQAMLKPNASGEETGFQFGGALAIDNNILVAGAARYKNKEGAAYVFERTGSDWKQIAILAGLDTRSSRGTSSGDLFGGSVSIYGNTIVIGAGFHDSEGPNNGAAYVFVQEGSKWIQRAKLTAPK